MAKNTSAWGKETATKRYARGGALSDKAGTGPFPGQSEKDFVEGEDRKRRSTQTHGGQPYIPISTGDK